jgi:mRNA interferase HigB
MAMRILSRRRLREYWSAVPAAESPLCDWFTKVRYATWPNFAAVRRTFNSADAVGNCTVFNVGGNRFRVIARIIHAKRRVYILRVMTHVEYDRTDWVTACGCHEPPPKRGRS